MSLTPKEEQELRKLTEKSKMKEEPLSDDDLLKIQQNLDQVYDEIPSMFRDIAIAGWQRFTAQLSVLSEDNSKLLKEVKRLKEVVNEEIKD